MERHQEDKIGAAPAHAKQCHICGAQHTTGGVCKFCRRCRTFHGASEGCKPKKKTTDALGAMKHRMVPQQRMTAASESKEKMNDLPSNSATAMATATTEEHGGEQELRGADEEGEADEGGVKDGEQEVEKVDYINENEIIDGEQEVEEVDHINNNDIDDEKFMSEDGNTTTKTTTTIAAAEDPNAWRQRIILRAVECCDDVTLLSTPPFSFYQHWDPQYQKKGKKKRKKDRRSSRFDEGSGRKKRRGSPDYTLGGAD